MIEKKPVHEQARDFWDDKASFFASEERRQKNRRMSDLYEKSCWRYIEPLLPPSEGCLILEAGCGTGRWVYYLAPIGYHLELLDFSGEMIRHAEANVTQHGLEENVTGYHVQDICDMTALADNSFDMILALGMPLSLCNNPKQAVAEMFRVTKPGGHVVCDVKNRLRAALDLARDNDMVHCLQTLNTGAVVAEPEQVHSCFSAQELEALFLKQGFKPCITSAIMPFFDIPPSKEQVAILDDGHMFSQIDSAFQAVAEDPGVLGLTSRLLVVVQKLGDSEKRAWFDT